MTGASFSHQYVVLLLEVKDVDSNKEHSDKEALAYEQDGESLVGS